MHTTNSDAFRLLFDKNNINIQFGKFQSGSTDQDNKNIDLLDDIVMDPTTVRRFISSLNESLRSHEHRYGLMDSASSSKTNPKFINSENTQFNTVASHLLDLINRLGIPYYFEPSFRICEQQLLTDRFLITVNLHELHFQPLQCMLDICSKLNMSEEHLEIFKKEFTKAKCIHFGLEGKGDSVICKAYLEFRASTDDIKIAVEPSTLLHLAFKWDVLKNNKHVITRYYWYPLLNSDDLLKRIENIYQGNDECSSFNIVRDLVEFIANKTPVSELQYLEVIEDENERRSFDLNLYDVRLQLCEIYPVIKKMRDNFNIRPGEFQELYDRTKQKVIGHIAGGIHRNKKEFFNVYYGVEKHHG